LDQDDLLVRPQFSQGAVADLACLEQVAVAVDDGGREGVAQLFHFGVSLFVEITKSPPERAGHKGNPGACKTVPEISPG